MAGKLTIGSSVKLNSGYKMPRLGYGVYQTPVGVCEDVVLHALKSGYRHIDSAIGYHNEAPSASGMLASSIPRSSLFFTTKIPPSDINYTAAKAHIAESLSRIGKLEYIDLLLLHAPFGGKEGRLGAWRALVEAVSEGKVRSIGVSNYAVHHLDELDEWQKEVEEKEGRGKGGILSVNQVELHPWLQRKEIVEWCTKRGVVCEAYCPIVRNTRGEESVLKEISGKWKKTSAQVLLRWSLQKGFVPLPKSVTHSRIEENADIYDFELDAEDIKKLDFDTYEPCSWDPTTCKD